MAYTLETRRLVARSPLLPALTQEQIRRVATPTIIITRPSWVDESRVRRQDPTIYDLADLTPLQRWKRTHTEDLREPMPGGLVQAGQCIMPWGQYARAAARNQTPPELRVRVGHKLVEHTLAPCENHLMVPLGYQAMSYAELKRVFLGHRHKAVPQADHVHEVSVELVDGSQDGHYRWSCRRCEQSGFEHYPAETLGRATGVVWHGCLKCMSPTFQADHSRRAFLSWGAWGIAAMAGYSAWLRDWSRPIVAVPYVPPAEGAANTFFVDFKNGNDTTGTGATGAPWKTYEKARTQMTAGNADTVKGRGGDVSDERYDESFNFQKQWPAGTSYALATTVTKDTGHTPVIRPTTASALTAIIWNYDDARQYIIYNGLTLDGNGAGTRSVLLYQHSSGNSNATAPHHIRADGCTMGNIAVSTSGCMSHAYAQFCESLSCVFHTTSSDGQQGIHGLYCAGPDNLMQACESTGLSGYGAHFYTQVTETRSHRSVIRYCRLHSGSAGDGIIMYAGLDRLIYYNLAYNNGLRGGGIRISGGSTANTVTILNNTVVGNFEGGIQIDTNGVATLKNNIAVGNSNYQFLDVTGNAIHDSTNSWNIAGFDADFIDQAGFDLHLGEDSDAIGVASSIASTINAGTFPVSSVVDFDGVSVPQQTTPDAGALEFEAGGGGGGGGVGVGGDNPSKFRRGRVRR